MKVGDSMENMIDAKGLVHEYSRRDENGNVTEIKRALDGVDIKVKQGDFIAVLGANGSGKSTFAKHLNALLVPTEGTLFVNGMDTSDSDNDLKIRQTAGMVFQNPDNHILSLTTVTAPVSVSFFCAPYPTTTTSSSTSVLSFIVTFSTAFTPASIIWSS